MKALKAMGALAVLTGVALLPALAQNGAHCTSDSVRGHFVSVNRRVLEMAKDFPEDKYNDSLKPEMRSFGAVIVHIASGNAYAAKAVTRPERKLGRAGSQELTKDEVVALLEQSIFDANATLKTLPDASFARALSMVERYGAFRRTLRTSCSLLPRKRSGPARVTAEQLKKPELQRWLRKTKVMSSVAACYTLLSSAMRRRR